MADEQKPEGSQAAPPPGGEAPAPPAKPAAPAAKPAAPKPAAAAHAAPPKPPATMAATPWESELTKRNQGTLRRSDLEASTYLGQNFLVVKPDSVVPLIEYLKLEADFDYLVDITAVDWPKRPERFDIVYILYSFARNERVRVKAISPRATGRRPWSVSI